MAFIFPASAAPDQPQQLRSAIYSPQVAELFWDRADEPLSQYDVYRDDTLLSAAQFGISYFDPTLEAGQSYTYSVIAIDQQGERSEPAAISIDTPHVDQMQPLVPVPQNLRVAQYSPNVAELFWDRAADPLTQYDVFRNDNLLSAGQFGISYFDATLDQNINASYTVVAIDAQGNRSADAAVVLDHGSSLQQPENLSVAVYSLSATELFWARQDAGQSFVIVRDGSELAITDGTSFFDDTVPGGGSYTYQVMAVDETGARSSPASIVAIVGDTSQSDNGLAISLENAENLVREVISITTGAVFEPMLQEAQRVSDMAVAVSFASLSGQSIEPNGITLVEGSNGGLSELGTSGFNGGAHTCDAGGAAAVPAFLAFESSAGYVVVFDECALSTGIYTGTYQLITPVPRSGNLGNDELVDWLDDQSNGSRYQVQFYSEGTTTQYADRSQRTTELEVNDFKSTIGEQQVSIDELTLSRVTRSGTSLDYEQLDSEGVPTEREFAEASLTASFVVSAVYTEQQPMTVEISLAYDYAGVENPSLLWQSGQIIVRAGDGSELRAIPDVQDAQNVRITVGDSFVDVPYDDVF